MNDTRPALQTPISAYLEAIATLDVSGGYVAPKEDVARRLEREIQQKTGCVPATLATEHAFHETKLLDTKTISADPATFAQEALQEVDRLCAALEGVQAKRFEVAFHNFQNDPTTWGDQIHVAVRYTV